MAAMVGFAGRSAVGGASLGAGLKGSTIHPPRRDPAEDIAIHRAVHEAAGLGLQLDWNFIEETTLAKL